MFFGQNFCPIWDSKPHFGKVRDEARPWLMAHWKARSQLFICINWTFSAIYNGSAVEVKCAQLGCFHRGRPLCAQILPGQVVPINHSWHQKTRDTGLPNDRDRIPLCSVILTQYRSAADRQTDGRICRSMYSACIASFAARCDNGGSGCIEPAFVYK